MNIFVVFAADDTATMKFSQRLAEALGLSPRAPTSLEKTFEQLERADLLLVDSRLRNLKPLELLNRVRESNPRMATLLLSSEKREPQAEVRTGPTGIVPLQELKKRAILRAIKRLSGDKVGAARRLGIGKTTLYRRLKQYSAET